MDTFLAIEAERKDLIIIKDLNHKQLLPINILCNNNLLIRKAQN